MQQQIMTPVGACSAVEHVARYCCDIGQWEDVHFAMFTVTLDASCRAASDGWLVVAGFAAGANVWKDFSELWNARLLEDGGVKYYNADAD